MSATTALRGSTSIRFLHLPAEDHPLYPLFVQHQTIRDLAIEASAMCERISPMSSTLAEADPVDALSPERREAYLRSRSTQYAYETAAYRLELAIDQVIENLGGM